MTDARSQGNLERFHDLRWRLNEHHEVSRALLTDDAEWVNPDDAVEPGIRRGADSFLQAVKSVFEGWEESIFEIERVMERDEHVIALGQLRTRGRATGIEASSPHGEIWTFDAGRVARLRWFNTHRETLAAAGLDEP
jgi:ketosteroid isomerase-like protein